MQQHGRSAAAPPPPLPAPAWTLTRRIPTLPCPPTTDVATRPRRRWGDLPPWLARHRSRPHCTLSALAHTHNSYYCGRPRALVFRSASTATRRAVPAVERECWWLPGSGGDQGAPGRPAAVPGRLGKKPCGSGVHNTSSIASSTESPRPRLRCSVPHARGGGASRRGEYGRRSRSACCLGEWREENRNRSD